MSKHRILLLDDEPEVLKALTRILRKDYEVASFTDGEEALRELHRHLYSVLITDMRMPGIDGATFLQNAHEISPLSQKILLTGYSDPKDTTAAINLGHIDFYLNKPWDNDDLIAKLKVCIENFVNEYQQRLINKQIINRNEELLFQQGELEQKIKKNEQTISHSESEKANNLLKLKQYFQTSVEVLVQCIKMHNLDPFGHGDRIATQVQFLCESFKLSSLITYQTVVAARLYELGKMQFPQTELEEFDRQQLTDSGRRYRSFLDTSAGLLRGFSDFSGVSAIIRHIFENIDGSGGPSGLKAEKVPIPCQIIQICAAYDKLVTGKVTGQTVSPSQALIQIQTEKKNLINAKVINAFATMVTKLISSTEKPIEYALSTKQLQPGMTLAHDLPLEAAKSNYLNKGHVLTQENVSSLQNIARNRESPMILFVYPQHD